MLGSPSVYVRGGIILILTGECYFAYIRVAHGFYNLLLCHALSEEEHQLGQCRLSSAVVATYHTYIAQSITCTVQLHLYATGTTLCNIDNNYAALNSIAQLVEEPIVSRCIA